MINNLDIILPLLEFKEEGDFYTILILQRKKDDNTTYSNKQSARTIKTYTIYNLEYLHHKYPEIIGLCEYFEARAYINLNTYNDSEIPLKMIAKMVHFIENKNYKVQGAYDSVVGTLSSKRKLWIVDVDKEHVSLLEEIKNKVNELEPFGNKIVAEIPSRSGIHLITTPFRYDFFQNWCKEKEITIDVLKKNPTCLYVSSSVMNLN